MREERQLREYSTTLMCRVFLILPVIIQALLLCGCSGRAYHQGLKMMQERRCYELEGEQQTECLQSLDYSIDEYEKEREKLKQQD